MASPKTDAGAEVHRRGRSRPGDAEPGAAALSVHRWLPGLMLAAAGVLYLLHFLHLRADFPNNSPWMDWAKYTDEGWYGDAAIRHALFGHWYLRGDFNPAVALPVWPLLLAGIFHFTGASLVAARATTLVVFGAMLVALYALIERFTATRSDGRSPSLAAPLAVLLFCANPFFFAFERMAVLEPLLAALTVFALLLASVFKPARHAPRVSETNRRRLLLGLALGLLLPAMILTKTTGVALIPAVGCMLWYRAGCRLRPALRMAAIPALLGAGIWAAYLFVLVRPHYLEDYQYLFDANAYTGFQLQPLATVLFNTFSDGYWIGAVLYPAFFAGAVWFVFTRPAFFRNPLVASLLVWLAGYFVFLAYHNNLQPRYYLVPAVPLTVLVALMADALLASVDAPVSTSRRILRSAVVTVVLGAILVPDVLLELHFIRHPEYTFLNAARSIASIVRAEPNHSQRILSISGSDITLMTGLPSIDDDFGTLDLDQRVLQYRPGWYVAWNELEDDKMDALRPLYQPVRVATFPAMDDPDRNQLILYRLDPATSSTPLRRRRRKTPKPLRTKLGQQPTTTQLQH